MKTTTKKWKKTYLKNAKLGSTIVLNDYFRGIKQRSDKKGQTKILIETNTNKYETIYVPNNLERWIYE